MSFQLYVDQLMSDGRSQDAALVEFTGNKSVLASVPGGIFANITPEEVDVLTGPDRERLAADEVAIGGRKCVLIRDAFLVEEDMTMDLKMKGEEEQAFSISVGKARTVLVFVMGKKDASSQHIHAKAFAVANFLRQSGL